MAAVRTFVAGCVKSHGIHPRLICNYDQVWTVMYRHSNRVRYKVAEKEGTRSSTLKPSVQKILTSIRQALNLEPAEREDHAYEVRTPQLDAQANISPMEGWRLPRTTTTLSWNDGELGAAWVTVKDGSAPAEVIQRLNEELKGTPETFSQDSGSHMWSSSSMLYYLEFLTTQLRLRRQRLGLSMKDGKALVICDKATVHTCTAFDALRERWEVENNAIILNGTSADLVKIPGGWGAAGAPNDGFHQFFHVLRQSYQKLVGGQGKHLHLRKAIEDLELGVDGSYRHKLPGGTGTYTYMYVYIKSFSQLCWLEG